MFHAGSEARDLLLIAQGQAALVLLEPGHDETIIGDMAAGDVVGLLNTMRGEVRTVAIRAVTDCEVIVLPSEVTDEVGSRNADLVAAFNRVAALRERRINRLVERRRAALPSTTEADAS